MWANRSLFEGVRWERPKPIPRTLQSGVKDVAEHLRDTVRGVLPRLRSLREDEVRANPYPPRWSKVEVLGHLVDSACNNQQKFVRTMEVAHLEFPGYAQNHWTASQGYAAASWSPLVELFGLYNEHLSNLIERVPREKLRNTITVLGPKGPAGPFTLEFIMRDYVEHLKHHLLQILPDAPLRHTFQNVYGA